MKLFVSLLPFLVPLTWGLGVFFGGMHAKDASVTANNTGLEGTLFVGLGYFFWCVLVLFMTGGKVLSGWQWHGSGIAFGLTFSLGGLVFALAMKYASSPTSVIVLSSLYPAVATILAFFFLNDSMTAKKIFGIVLAVVAGWLLA